MKILKYLLLPIIVISFAGCLYKPLNINENNKNTRVGIVSIVDGKMDLEFIGTTMFQNKFNTQNIENWDIPNFLIQSTKKELIEKSELTIIDINYDINQLKKKAYTNDKLGYFSGYYPNEDLKKDLKILINNNKLDYLIVIFPSISNGIELYKRDFLGNGFSIFKFYYSLKLIDKKDLDVKTQYFIEHKENISNSYWKEDQEEFNKEILGVLESTTKNNIKKKIHIPLEKMGLIIK
ncbi:hypothetical protein [Poseidonibacter lekithochrous]|uniref:hypothetical protein n=1 Tax=Poseidonibacter lekithochrous TaxID=1904463 RepID=UPI000D39C5EC|nr:hypothetical protein [Poseidonibacter lekithochrous]